MGEYKHAEGRIDLSERRDFGEKWILGICHDIMSSWRRPQKGT
jgi:hypothetical protein